MIKLARYSPYYWNASPLFRLAAHKLASRPATAAASLPPMDIEETDTHYVVTLSVPGYRQNQLSISAEDDRLHIRGDRTKGDAKADADRKYHLRERRLNRFARSLRLPQGASADDVQARYEAGVLTLNVPKPAKALPKRIEIQTG